MQILSIWIENEITLNIEGQPHNPVDTNSDVIVTMTNASRWVASFFSYTNIVTLTTKYRATGECLDGRYFWASDMILIDVVTRERITEVIHHLLAENSFTTVFTRLRDDLDQSDG